MRLIIALATSVALSVPLAAQTPRSPFLEASGTLTQSLGGPSLAASGSVAESLQNGQNGQPTSGTLSGTLVVGGESVSFQGLTSGLNPQGFRTYSFKTVDNEGRTIRATIIVGHPDRDLIIGLIVVSPNGDVHQGNLVQ